jgi:hypothetical protein
LTTFRALTSNVIDTNTNTPNGNDSNPRLPTIVTPHPTRTTPQPHRATTSSTTTIRR